MGVLPRSMMTTPLRHATLAIIPGTGKFSSPSHRVEAVFVDRLAQLDPMAAVVADLGRAKAAVKLVFGILENLDARLPQALDLPVHIGDEHADDGSLGHLNGRGRIGFR